MRRRTVLSSLAASTVATGGCMGRNEIVTSVQRTVSVSPGEGWVKRIPDAPAVAVQYVARASDPFQVFFFTNETEYMYYDTYLDGGKPARKPDGHEGVGATAEKTGEGTYRASTPDGGAREPVNTDGPYFFVVDYSDYRGGSGEETASSPNSVYLNLTVTKSKFGF